MVRLFRICIILAFLLPPCAWAQQPQPDTDLAAVDRVIGILSDDASRQRLIDDLRSLRTSIEKASPETVSTESQATEGPEESADTAQDAASDEDAPQDAILSDTGLMGAVAEWIADVARGLPNAALGAPIDVRLEQAEGQIMGRLSRSDTLAQLETYLTVAVPAWLIAAAVFWITRRLLRNSLGDDGLVGLQGTELAKGFVLRLVAGLLPALAAGLAILLFANIAGLPASGVQLVMLPASPFLIALAAQRQFCLFLTLLGRSRGWKLVVYAQRRLAPWIGTIIAISAFGGVMTTPSARTAIGWATAEIASLVLDLAATVVSFVTVAKHRRTIRSLIVKRGRPRTPAPESPLSRTITSLGNRWHLLAYAFLTLNIGARLLGTGRGNFIVQAVVSIMIVVAALIVVSILDRRFEAYAERIRRKWNSGTRDAVLVRLAHVGRSIAQGVVFLVAAATCLSLWGFNLLDWTGTETGQAVLRPVLAIAIALLAAWILWISLDAWIDSVLTATNRRGQTRARTSRIKTLLPLLRNVAFVVLSVLTIIAVLANLGVNVAPLLAGAGVVGLAVGFGSQQLVQDVITGLFILLEDTLAIGDVVDTGDRSGVVEALTIRTVKIRDGDGALHSVPFSSIKALKNSSRDFGVYTVSITLDPSADVDRAVAAMKDVGREVAEDPKYATVILIPLDVWGVDQVSPDGIVIKGGVRTRALQQWGVGREINRRLMIRLAELGIPLASRSFPNVRGEAAEQLQT